MPWEMSSSRNVPKSCSWPRRGWARVGALIPRSHPCAQPPRTSCLGRGSPRRPISAPQTLPHGPREMGPALPHGSTSSCPGAAERNGSGGRREGADACRGISCLWSRSCCRGSRFRVLLAVPVASSTSSSGQSYKKCWKSQPCGVSSFKLVFNSVPKQFNFPKHQSPQSNTGRGRASPMNPGGSCAPLPCPTHGG